MKDKPTLKGKTDTPLRELAFRSSAIRFMDNSLLEAVFSGGYYIVLTHEEIHASGEHKIRSQQARNRKNEEALRLANLAHQLSEITSGNLPTSQTVKSEPEARTVDIPSSRRERLLEELQSLINRSNFNNTDFDQHLAHELGIARQQVLRGGAIDDYALMQTLQEIASIQGLSTIGSSVGGRFASDIMNTPEPENTAFTSSSLNNDPEHFFQREFDQFSAYSIREMGGFKHVPSYFFARKIMTSLLSADALSEQEQNSSEMTP